MYVAKICLNLESIETLSNNRNNLQNSKIVKKVTSLTYCLKLTMEYNPVIHYVICQPSFFEKN